MHALKITDVHKTYGQKSILSGVDLEIEEGDFFALLGHNGAGKTTTIGIVTDLVKKTSGKVEVFGIDTNTHFNDAKRLIGVVPQEFNFNMWEKVKEIPVTQAGFYGIPRKEAQKRSEALLKTLHLWDEREKESRELSGGMKRRLMIARALVHHPKLLILDEPTAGVDVELRKTMWDFIIELNRLGTTILLTTHYLEDVEALCNKVAIMNGGKIIESCSTQDLLKQLDEEVFVLDIQMQGDFLLSHPGIKQFRMNLISATQMEITLQKGDSLNEVFKALDSLGIKVQSLRNKSNRIEQLFLSLTK